jgi:hypothetical protein
MADEKAELQPINGRLTGMYTQKNVWQVDSLCRGKYMIFPAKLIPVPTLNL